MSTLPPPYFSNSDYKSVAQYLGYPWRDRPVIAIQMEKLAIARGEDWVIEVQQILLELDQFASRKSQVAIEGTIASESISGEFSVSYETGSQKSNLNFALQQKLAELVSLLEISPNWNQAKLLRS
jgi:hypothetical protein